MNKISRLLYSINIILLLAIFLPMQTLAQYRITGGPYATRSEVIAQRGMAATSQPLATQAALDILKQGGTAVDAVIAANAVLGVVEPTGCGLGGDLFAIVWDNSSKRLYGLNASGRSPRALTLEYFIKQGYTTIPALGPLPVTVPGCVDGWYELHDRFGKLPMETILQPAIQYAEKGFPVTELIAYYMEINARYLKDFPGFAETFMPNGHTPRKGEVFKNPRLATTLKKIAQDGRERFYRGDIAHIITNYVQEQGGFLSYEDLATHRSEWVEPIHTSYRGYDVWELPPNGQGIATLQMLNILEKYDLASMGFGSAEYIHTFVEAKKVVYEDRAKYYADPDFNEIPVKRLISKEYAQQRQKLINAHRVGKSYSPGIFENGETVYLTVADKEGNMASLIQSNYRGMGSGMTPGELGFVLQDRGELFSLEKGHFNVYEPGKRPFHTIIPAFVTHNGEPFMSFGVMGGAMQPQGQVQVLVNIIDFGMNLQEAGDAPRIRHVGSSQPTGEIMTDGGKVYLEPGFPQEVINQLRSLGHNIEIKTGGYGGYQAIRWDPVNMVYYGASESRKDGQAGGY
jgi:gamma-glutamyltranspeptidase/glutathione hydrolase